MNLLGLILGLPLAPIRGVIALAEVIQKRVEQELKDPASARRELEQAEAAEAAGEISEKNAADIERRVASRMTGKPAARKRASKPAARRR